MLSPARGGEGELPLGIANPGFRFRSTLGYLLTPVPGCGLGFSSQLLILTPGSGLLTSASCKDIKGEALGSLDMPCRHIEFTGNRK